MDFNVIVVAEPTPSPAIPRTRRGRTVSDDLVIQMGDAMRTPRRDMYTRDISPILRSLTLSMLVSRHSQESEAWSAVMKLVEQRPVHLLAVSLSQNWVEDKRNPDNYYKTTVKVVEMMSRMPILSTLRVGGLVTGTAAGDWLPCPVFPPDLTSLNVSSCTMEPGWLREFSGSRLSNLTLGGTSTEDVTHLEDTNLIALKVIVPSVRATIDPLLFKRLPTTLRRLEIYANQGVFDWAGDVIKNTKLEHIIFYFNEPTMNYTILDDMPWDTLKTLSWASEFTEQHPSLGQRRDQKPPTTINTLKVYKAMHPNTQIVFVSPAVGIMNITAWGLPQTAT